MSYEERMRTLGLCGLGEDLIATNNDLRRGSGEGGAEILFPGAWNRGRAQSCAEAHTALTFG